MTCVSLLGALKNTDINFNNDNKTFCISSTINFNWFNSTAVVPLPQLIGIHKVLQSNHILGF